MLSRFAMNLPDFKTAFSWALSVLIAALGGWIATQVGTPLPWLLGAMVAIAASLALGVRVLGQSLSFPQAPRLAFITIIGVAIGGSAEPGMWHKVAEWWTSLLAVAVFVLLAQTMNYQVFRRIARYDRPTAFYCATPGGLIESVQLGEEAGGNPALLTVQHFSRIAITVTLVPLIYWAVRGEAVGSAAGVSMDQTGGAITPAEVVLLLACAILGGWGGRRIGFPAAIITGPIILSAVVHGAGLTQAQPPDWLIAVAQVVIGLGLAMRFKGLSPKLLVSGIGLGALTVSGMLALGGTLAWLLSLTGAHSAEVLFMCFAPGGVVEMGLIALSLGVSPVFVTLHHILRIGFTVMAVPFAGRWILGPNPQTKPDN